MQVPLLFFLLYCWPDVHALSVICPALRGICWHPMLGTICHTHTLGLHLSGSSLNAFVHSRVWMYGLEMLDRTNSNTKEIKRHKIVMGGQPRNTESTHVCFIWSLNTPIQKRLKSRRLFYCGARTSKVIIILTPKTPSNHTAGQDIFVSSHTVS